MKLDIAGIARQDGASAEFAFSEQMPPFTFGGLDYAFAAPVRFEGKIVNQHDFLEMTGRLQTVLQLHCARCLSPFEYPLDVEFEEEFARTGDPDHPDRRVFEGDVLLVDPLVEEYVLSEIPLEQLCTPTCKGLCPVCGMNLNEGDCSCQSESADRNPFSVLKSLLNEDEEV